MRSQNIFPCYATKTAETKQDEYMIKYSYSMSHFELIHLHPLVYLKLLQIPRKINWEDHITRGSDHWEWQKAVSVLFDERPIWHTISLNHCLLDKGLRVGAHMFKRLLFRTAYYFSTGPYRQLWIRKGYDPRKDPESRIYQRIDFRVPPPLRHIGDVHATDKLKHMWKDLCALRVFPCKCQISLQLFELDDDYIREEIRKPPEDTCSCSTGWFSSFVHDSLKLRIAVRFLSVYPKMGAESLLKSASLRFEKSKRARALKSDFRPKEMEHQLNKESSSHLSKVSPTKLKDTDLVFDNGKDEYDDDEDNNDGYDYIEEEEEEDEEEEMDEYESYQVDAGDGDFTLNPLSYPIGENISKNYLQELFGSFPSTEAASNKDQEVEFSDAEYQIFEQDSDDNANYSGDDDY
ncbi:hypothetical protein IFM89_029064 [Coptis chinensis]|uniref:Transcription factor IIIC subunit 5 HTH domain-containing protein n=1 Tax=Coptis chinensis TaxID=261450 RepID=A0A835IIF6_9MAGN|nr:hypothetical protein IFM89_029064 [Coptis chinensis]